MPTPNALLPGEEQLAEFGKGILTLTTKRVRLDSRAFGQTDYIGITLDSVASCGLVTKSYPLILFLGLAAALYGTTQPDEPRLYWFVGAGLAILIFLLTRRSLITIASNGGSAITVPAARKSRSDILEFLAKVEDAKLTRV